MIQNLIWLDKYFDYNIDSSISTRSISIEIFSRLKINSSMQSTLFTFSEDQFQYEIRL